MWSFLWALDTCPWRLMQSAMDHPKWCCHILFLFCCRICSAQMRDRFGRLAIISGLLRRTSCSEERRKSSVRVLAVKPVMWKNVGILTLLLMLLKFWNLIMCQTSKWIDLFIYIVGTASHITTTSEDVPALSDEFLEHPFSWLTLLCWEMNWAPGFAKTSAKIKRFGDCLVLSFLEIHSG